MHSTHLRSTHWQTSRFRIDLSRPQVMGIVNITPDSFSDGGQHASVHAALAHCERLLGEGADILDLGGESSRPGSQALPLEEELRRVLPVVREAVRLKVPLSIDTYKPQVMEAVLELGADVINDIFALRAEGAVQVVARHSSCGICLMHMRGEPQSMHSDAVYAADVVTEVRDFLAGRAAVMAEAGISPGRIVLDPGIGFGKTPAHNVALLARQEEFLTLGLPLLAGWSRKSTLGTLTGRPVEQRLPASLAAALAAVQRGASVVRVHDVAATVDALKVWNAAGLGRGAVA